MGQDEVIAVCRCSNMASSWTEYLCMEIAPDGSVTLTSKSHKVLGFYGEVPDEEIVWPEGFDPEDEDCDERPLPVSIYGMKVADVEDGIYVGEALQPHSDDSTATFKPGEAVKAVDWVLSYYRGAYAKVGEETLSKVRAALRE